MLRFSCQWFGCTGYKPGFPEPLVWFQWNYTKLSRIYRVSISNLDDFCQSYFPWFSKNCHVSSTLLSRSLLFPDVISTLSKWICQENTDQIEISMARVVTLEWTKFCHASLDICSRGLTFSSRFNWNFKGLYVRMNADFESDKTRKTRN